MPAEHDFTDAQRGPRRQPRGAATVRVERTDGTIEERAQTPAPRADAAVASPGCLTGVFGDALYYVYDPDADILSVRLLASLGEAVELAEEQHGSQVVRTTASGRPVGLFVRRFLQRLDEPATEAEVSADLLERGFRRLHRHLPWAA